MLKDLHCFAEKVEDLPLDNLSNWELVPEEDLWEDGEISNNTCMIKIYNEVVVEGNWKLIRRKDE